MTEAENLISIIVPVYNAGRYIKETMDSVRRQTWPARGLFLIEDGNSGGSGEMI